VSGSHTYPGFGTYTITVTVTHDQLAPVSVTSTAVVAFNVGILLLDPTASGALSITGNGTIAVAGSSAIVVDSSSASAVNITGNGLIQANELDVAGNP